MWKLCKFKVHLLAHTMALHSKTCGVDMPGTATLSAVSYKAHLCLAELVSNEVAVPKIAVPICPALCGVIPDFLHNPE